ncbi:MAG TPA: hypothetical protein VL178_15345, partial [Pseudomonas sp.]|nr:hypothetical protein [Pseudomonas sp.]
GPQAVPEPTVVHNAGMTVWQSYVHDYRKAVAERDPISVFLWEGVVGLIIVNSLLIHYLLRKKLAHLPDLTAPEAMEWSKPLPPGTVGQALTGTGAGHRRAGSGAGR